LRRCWGGYIWNILIPFPFDLLLSVFLYVKLII
jgi:hypothetical protein